ncbi:serine/threonine-protein kinase Nek11 [Aplysia californica]|uniref:non-specific serine/threonine protein kinase n=1 Tax=Aplysia californica TaxID=6500 RepID=A0ABM0K0A9_APLCA|nr:serine/threonine-protein kinase Nek11 [Aplysia californica]
MAPSRPTKDRESKEARVLANRYEIVKKLGSGNFGTAFLCKDRKCNNEFKVLKEISVGDLQPDETVDAMHEARLLSKLDHPGIVKFHDSFIDGEFFCIVTEYCEGGDLDHKITEYKKKGKSFDEKTVLNWTIQLILAVQYMHSRRVLHRDLKTRNIFIRNNMMKIGDFGISRILMGTMDMASTFTGTPYYMSPEVLKHEGYNSKSDVWSIGCIMYELCTLEHAFIGQGLMAVMYKIVEKEPPDLPKKYSKDIDDVFKKMLIKDPEKRPSATEVTKFPHVARHMAKMKDLLTDEYKTKHNINPETADKEASELAVLLREKSRLDDLRSTVEKSSEEEDSDQHSYQAAAKPPKLTARERMRLKKMQEADKRAQDLKKATKIQLVENTERREKIKTNFEKTTLPAWKGGYGEGTLLKEAITVRDPRLGHLSPREYGTLPDHHYHGYDSSDEEEMTVKHSTMYRRNSDRSGPKSNTVGSDYLKRSQSQKSPRTLTDRSMNSLSMTVQPPHGDERPITPMRDLMVYDREHSSLDFKDGIPETPDLANTFYEQFNEFDDDADVVVGGGANDSDEAEGTLVDDPGQKEEEDFINYLERALDKDEAESTTVSDDSVLGAFGPHARETKIKNLKGECVKIMGEEEFQKAYNYLRSARTSQDGKEKSEKEIMDGLRKYVKNPSDCFMVDQLLFLEEQAKLS